MKDDLISRQAMINEINLHVGILYDNPTLVESLKLLVWSLPSAQLAQDLTKGCTDTISRVAAIKAADSIIERDTSGNNDVVKAMTAWKEYIKALPSEQPVEDARAMCGECDAWNQYKNPQPGWIPCTPETMPKMTDTYLVKVGINENGEGMHTEVRTAEWGVISRTWYVHEHENSIIGEVTEWMPIPLPYREGEQKDGDHHEKRS